MDEVAQKLAKSGAVDMLDGGAKANPKPSLANGVPTIYTSQVPAELIVFKGQPDFVPIVGTELLWASNTTNDVLIDTANSNYYVLLAGRWFRSTQLTRPVDVRCEQRAAAQVSRRFRRPRSPAPCCHRSPERRRRRKRVIANSIPQTATVPRVNGPKFTPSFDGPPQYDQIQGTSISPTSSTRRCR